MLNPPRSGIVLSDLDVAFPTNLTVETDGDRCGARRAFVEAQDDLVDVGFQARFRLPVE
jgi:hypothetical protein